MVVESLPGEGNVWNKVSMEDTGINKLSIGEHLNP